MKKTEKLVVRLNENCEYYCKAFNFVGTLPEARNLASLKGFGGGVELYENGEYKSLIK